ncbi:MAG: hypothetical protein EBZ74_01570 [Planctomycetia bacterium]|nr:hypothetical protein [Planctomycetia bacterium]
MFLAEPQTTPVDLELSIARVPVRVSAWFWVAAALLGWNVCQALAGSDQRELLRLLVAWVGVVFASLLVHELGHAFAYRAFGQACHVVLYHFGGLAIPDVHGRRGARRPLERLVVSAAGPLAQLALAAALVIGLKAAGFRVPCPIEWLREPLGLSVGRPLPSHLVGALVWFSLQVNVFWPLVNLLPVPPLDGGQIAREALLALGVADAPRIAGLLGALTGGLVAFWAYSRNEPYLGVMFAMLAVSCWQNLPGNTPWRRWN